jgi:hypothetical protein
MQPLCLSQQFGLYFRGMRWLPTNPLTARRYKRCAVKTVKIETYYQSMTDAGEVWTTDEPADPTDHDIGLSAVLHCPRSDGELDTEVGYEALRALTALQRIATASVCRGCPYGRLSRVEADERLAAEATARAQRLRAQTALEAAQLEHNRVIALGMQALNEIQGAPPSTTDSQT